MLEKWIFGKDQRDIHACRELLKKRREDLAALQQPIKEAKLPVIVLVEGWGAAGKGSVIHSLIRELDPRFFKVRSVGMPTEEERRWPFLKRHFDTIPEEGKILLCSPERDGREGEEQILFHRERKINRKPQQRRVGYLFQNYALFPNMTVEENIRIGLKSQGKKGLPGNGERLSRAAQDARVEEMIRRFRLSGLEKRYPGQLSGGQQQRTALARILAYEPRVLLLDEPFSAMDTYLREGLRLELARVLKDYDGASVMVTHDRDEAYQLCDYLLLMDNGHVLTAGRTRDIFQNPGTCQAARLTGCKNISRIERLGARQVKALDWNGLVLTTEQEVGPEISAVGIRAHDLEPAADGIGINRIPVGNGSVTEMPFEWYVTLENGLWWKVEKTIHTHDSAGVIPQWLTVQPEAVLLLRGE